MTTFGRKEPLLALSGECPLYPESGHDGYQVSGRSASILNTIQKQISLGVSIFLQSKFNVRGFSRLGIVLLLLDVPIGMSRVACGEEFEQKPEQTIDEMISETVEQESSESIEEIIVYGDKSLHDLRLEVYKAEEKFFDVFNSVNEDNEFDVRCFYEVPSFTHIRRHVCRANFVTNATSGGAIVFMGADAQYPVVPAGTIIVQKKRRMQKIMESLVAERPELLQALSEYTDKKQTFESEKENK